MPLAKTKKKAEEKREMAPIVFQLPAEFAEKITGRLGESDAHTGKSIDDLKNSLSALGSSLFSSRTENRSALMQHRTLSQQELLKHKKEVDQVVKELEEAFAVLWPKFDEMEKAMKKGDSDSIEHAADKFKEASELTEKRYQSALKKLNISKADLDKSFKDEVKRLEKMIKVVGKYEYGSSLNILASGTPVGFTGILNFKSGFTIALNGAQIDISASGSGFSLLIPTGAVNGTNKTFVFASAPSVISLDNGNLMNKTSSDGTQNWTGTTTVTLTQAPNFNIYGF